MDALNAAKHEFELWNTLNSPSETGYMVERVVEGNPLHLAVAALQEFYNGELPKPANRHWRKFLRLTREDDEAADGECDWLVDWIDEEISKVDVGSSVVVVKTVGDLWKALSEGLKPAITASAISLGPPFGPNIAEPKFPVEGEQTKWNEQERALALCDAKGGERVEAMRQLIGRVAIRLNVDRRQVINMPLGQFVAIASDEPTEVELLLDELMSPPACDIELTKRFRNEKHDRLLERLQSRLETTLPANPQISITQSLQDAGCDLVIVDSDGTKYGIQLKSNGDAKERDFATKTVAQIQDSRQHGIRRLYLILAADTTGESNLQKVRILVGRVSKQNDTFVRVVPPERALKLLFPGEFDEGLSDNEE